MLCCFRPPKSGAPKTSDAIVGQGSQQQLIAGGNVGNEPKGLVPQENEGATRGERTGNSDYSQGPQRNGAKPTASAPQKTPLVGTPSQEGVMRVVALLQELLSLTSERMQVSRIMTLLCQRLGTSWACLTALSADGEVFQHIGASYVIDFSKGATCSFSSIRTMSGTPNQPTRGPPSRTSSTNSLAGVSVSEVMLSDPHLLRGSDTSIELAAASGIPLAMCEVPPGPRPGLAHTGSTNSSTGGGAAGVATCGPTVPPGSPSAQHSGTASSQQQQQQQHPNVTPVHSWPIDWQVLHREKGIRSLICLPVTATNGSEAVVGCLSFGATDPLDWQKQFWMSSAKLITGWAAGVITTTRAVARASFYSKLLSATDLESLARALAYDMPVFLADTSAGPGASLPEVRLALVSSRLQHAVVYTAPLLQVSGRLGLPPPVVRSGAATGMNIGFSHGGGLSSGVGGVPGSAGGGKALGLLGPQGLVIGTEASSVGVGAGVADGGAPSGAGAAAVTGSLRGPGAGVGAGAGAGPGGSIPGMLFSRGSTEEESTVAGLVLGATLPEDCDREYDLGEALGAAGMQRAGWEARKEPSDGFNGAPEVRQGPRRLGVGLQSTTYDAFEGIVLGSSPAGDGAESSPSDNSGNVVAATAGRGSAGRGSAGTRSAELRRVLGSVGTAGVILGSAGSMRPELPPMECHRLATDSTLLMSVLEAGDIMIIKDALHYFGSGRMVARDLALNGTRPATGGTLVILPLVHRCRSLGCVYVFARHEFNLSLSRTAWSDLAEMLSRAIFTLLVGKVRHEWYQVLSEDMPQHVARQPGLHRRGSTAGSRRVNRSATADLLSGGGGVSASSSLRPSFEQCSYEPPLQFGSVGPGSDPAGGRVMLAAAAAALEYAGFCARTPSAGQELLCPSSTDGADRGMIVTGTNNALLAARQSTSPLTSTERERIGGSSGREHGSSMVAAAAAVAGLTVVPVMPRLKAAAGDAGTPEARSSFSGLVDAESIDETQSMAQPPASPGEQVDLESGAEGLLCDLASDIVVPCGPAPAIEGGDGSGSGGGPGSGAPAVSSSLVLVSGMGTGGGSPGSAQRVAASSGALPDAVSSSSPGSLSFRLPQGLSGPQGNNGGASGGGLMGAWPMGRSGGHEEDSQQASRSGVTSASAFASPGAFAGSLITAVEGGADRPGADGPAAGSGTELPDADAHAEADASSGAPQPLGTARTRALPPLVLSPHGSSASPSPGSTLVVRRILSSRVSFAGASGSGGSRDRAAGSGGTSGGAGGDVGPLLVSESTRRDGGDTLDTGLTSIAEAHADSLAAMMDRAAGLGMAMAESPSGLGLDLGLGLTSSSGREGRPGGAARPAASSLTTTTHFGTTGTNTGNALQTMSSGGDGATAAMPASFAVAGARAAAQTAGGTHDLYDSGQDGEGRAVVTSTLAPRSVGSGARTSSSPRQIGPASSMGRSSEPAAAELASCDCMTEAEPEGAEATEAEEANDSQGSSRELQGWPELVDILVDLHKTRNVSVYLAAYRGRAVALKMLRSNMSMDGGPGHLDSEALTIANLQHLSTVNHPNVLRVLMVYPLVYEVIAGARGVNRHSISLGAPPSMGGSLGTVPAAAHPGNLFAMATAAGGHHPHTTSHTQQQPYHPHRHITDLLAGAGAFDVSSGGIFLTAVMPRREKFKRGLALMLELFPSVSLREAVQKRLLVPPQVEATYGVAGTTHSTAGTSGNDGVGVGGVGGSGLRNLSSGTNLSDCAFPMTPSATAATASPGGAPFINNPLSLFHGPHGRGLPTLPEVTISNNAFRGIAPPSGAVSELHPVSGQAGVTHGSLSGGLNSGATAVSGGPPTVPPMTLVISILLQVAQGMAALHSSGLTHGELRAENVLLAVPAGTYGSQHSAANDRSLGAHAAPSRHGSGGRMLGGSRPSSRAGVPLLSVGHQNVVVGGYGGVGMGLTGTSGGGVADRATPERPLPGRPLPADVMAKIKDAGMTVVGTARGTQLVRKLLQRNRSTLLPFLPPEVHRGERLGRSADVYMFGLLMWELYTGGVAFTNLAGTPIKLLQTVIADGVRPPWPEGTPAWYQALACRCWAANPKQRPSFRRVADKLAEALSAAAVANAAAAAGWVAAGAHA